MNRTTSPFVRFRSKGALSINDKVSQSVNYLGTTWNWVSHSGGTQKWMYDQVTPGYRRILKEGVLMTAMTSTELSYSSDGSGYYLYNATDSSKWEGGGGDMTTALTGILPGSIPVTIPYSEVSDLEYEVSTKVRSDRGRSNANLAEALAERAKTVEMVRKPISSWVVKSSQMGFGRKAGLSLANLELMYRYGIKPLVKDLSQVLSNVKTIRPSLYTTRAHGNLQNESIGLSSAPWGSMVTVDRQIVDRCDVVVRAMSIDQDVAPIFTNLRSLGFDAKSLITLPYELVTLSFVADWFVNLGDCLGALADTVNFASVAKGACVVTSIDQTRVTALTSYQSSGFSTYIWTKTPHGVVSQRMLSKKRHPALLSPRIVVNSNFKLDSLTRIADSVALIGQRLLRIKT